jgi:hypothetical protein
MKPKPTMVMHNCTCVYVANGKVSQPKPLPKKGKK